MVGVFVCWMEFLIGREWKRIEESAPAHPGAQGNSQQACKGIAGKGGDQQQPAPHRLPGCWYQPPVSTNKVTFTAPSGQPSISPQRGDAGPEGGIFFCSTKSKSSRLNSQTGAWGNSNSSPSHLQSKCRSKKINQFKPGSIRVPILRN
ncbi:hypothetical protein PPACK8108_LOCUS22725 [Phakopsora pachyrhizi]|uniref:Uncharacterized protein n=1 Tax=Phakopsora pachyrhizi TaxID=170000 RepID=A0AAV0BQI8_PHAPC|nr:hypothetical protein PPACK8108_LOCUS22725 [Phakopsora pachyrhizi]